EAFRQAAPYINAHRGKTFVVAFGGEALLDDGQFATLLNDIALLHSLGARLVLVYGARPQVKARLREAGREMSYASGLRITDEAALECVKQAVGQVRIGIESRLSMGLPNSPMHGAHLRVISGNFVTARPVGVRDGVDYLFTGEVRSVDRRALEAVLGAGALVLLSPLGSSPTGETFNLLAEEVAVAAASALGAEKLLLLTEEPGPLDHQDKLIRQMSPSDAEQLLGEQTLPQAQSRHLKYALRAVRGGVRRAHLLHRPVQGGLIQELFTRDGIGTLVSADVYEGLRPATIEDVGGLLALLGPLEADGTLVRRSRELLEMEIDRFFVLERDGAIIGCAALYPFAQERVGELACVAVHPDYRSGGRAAGLLRFIERQARRQGLQRLFVLTTRSAHWFREQGFLPAAIEDLPVARQALYNLQRRSKVFIKPLD
ncbi:MAG: amino-acid N-acetyltransferase, partial [Candidatus Competibacteraceae bacterium]|nr:amino-acid N-acetyltransferase [Candidatus Competibacteraceae bacterium]